MTTRHRRARDARSTRRTLVRLRCRAYRAPPTWPRRCWRGRRREVDRSASWVEHPRIERTGRAPSGGPPAGNRPAHQMRAPATALLPITSLDPSRGVTYPRNGRRRDQRLSTARPDRQDEIGEADDPRRRRRPYCRSRSSPDPATNSVSPPAASRSAAGRTSRGTRETPCDTLCRCRGRRGARQQVAVSGRPRVMWCR